MLENTDDIIKDIVKNYPKDADTMQLFRLIFQAGENNAKGGKYIQLQKVEIKDPNEGIDN